VVYRPGPGRHSIWELAVHAAYWKYAVRRRLAAEKRGSFALEGSNFFTRPERFDPAAWNADLQLLASEHRAMLEPLANPETNIAWFALQILPLIAVLPGLLRASARSALLASLAAMLYFVHGVLVAATEPLRVFGVLECTAAIVLVASAALLVRALSRT
jgi:uncharacterized membrane protein